MLPYIFQANWHNYSRCLPIYILDMLKLPTDVENAFKDGHFAVKETFCKDNGIWTDMGAEKNIIKDTKSDSGIIGYTRREAAVLRWSLTRHILGQYTSALNNQCGLCDADDTAHDRCGPAAVVKDERDVRKLITHISENMTNPFDVTSNQGALVHLASGLHASEGLKTSLLGVVDRG